MLVYGRENWEFQFLMLQNEKKQTFHEHIPVLRHRQHLGRDEAPSEEEASLVHYCFVADDLSFFGTRFTELLMVFSPLAFSFLSLHNPTSHNALVEPPLT